MAEKVFRAERPDRAGMKTVVTYLPPEAAKLFKVIAAETDKSMQEIGEEALMDWLKKHNKVVTMVADEGRVSAVLAAYAERKLA